MSLKMSERFKRRMKKHWIVSPDDQFISLSRNMEELEELHESLVELRGLQPQAESNVSQSWTSSVMFLSLAVGIGVLLLLPVWRKLVSQKYVEENLIRKSTSASMSDRKKEKKRNRKESKVREARKKKESTPYSPSRSKSNSPKRTLLHIRKDPDRPDVKRQRKGEAEASDACDSDSATSITDETALENGSRTEHDIVPEREWAPLIVSESTVPRAALSTHRSTSRDALVDGAVASFKREADELARHILVAQGSFSEYGLSSELAVEFAMKTHFADRSDGSKMQREAIRQNLAERRHQETTSALYFDPDWQDKLTKARDSCLRSLLRSASYALALAAVLEIFFACPSFSRFCQVLMDCACGGESAADARTKTSGWLNYGYELYGFFTFRNRMEEPSYWSSLEPVSTITMFQPLTSYLRYARCLLPYVALLIMSRFLRFGAGELPPWAQNGLILLWFLHSEFITLGFEAMSFFLRYNVVPQLALGATCVHVTSRERSNTIRAMRMDPSGFHRPSFEASLRSFDSFKMWFTLLPFSCVIIRGLREYHGQEGPS